jgi:hypothetical protein
LLAALLWSPSVFLSLIPRDVLDPRLWPIRDHFRDSDPNQCGIAVAGDLALSDPRAADELLRLLGGTNLDVTLQDLEITGHQETAGSVGALVRQEQERRRTETARAELRGLAAGLVKTAGDESLGTEALVSAAEDVRAQAERIRSCLAPRDSLSKSILWGADLEAVEEPEYSSILGNQLLVRMDYGILYGEKGLGKSWIILLLAYCASCGEPFYGIETARSRVLVISLELTAAAVRNRILKFAPKIPGNLGVLGKDAFCPTTKCPDAPGIPRLADPAAQDLIVRTVRDSGADFVIIDPIGPTMADENAELTRVASFLVSLPVRTNSALLTTHHPRKPAPGEPWRSVNVLRGPTQYKDWAALILGVWAHQGRYLIGHPNNTYPRHAAPIPDIWVDRTPGGWFTQGDAPPSQDDQTAELREALREFFNEKGEIRVRDAAECLEKSEETIRKHLHGMGAKQHGYGKSARWALPEQANRPIANTPIASLGESPELPF